MTANKTAVPAAKQPAEKRFFGLLLSNNLDQFIELAPASTAHSLLDQISKLVEDGEIDSDNLDDWDVRIFEGTALRAEIQVAGIKLHNVLSIR